MSDCKSFLEFAERVGNDATTEILESICDAAFSKSPPARIRISDVHQHNAVNHTISGEVDHGGETFAFVMESGDRNGTVIHAWGDPESVEPYQPEEPTRYTFAPISQSLETAQPGKFAVYLEWMKQPWFLEKERGFNYDRHFAPGVVTDRHYREWAAKKGMHIVTVEDRDARIAAFKSNPPAAREV